MGSIKNYSFVTAVLAGAIFASGCSDDNFDGAESASTTATVNIGQQQAVVAAGDLTGSSAGGAVTIAQGTQFIDGNGATVNASQAVVELEAFDGSTTSEGSFTRGVTFTDPAVAEAIANALGQSIDSSRPTTVDLVGYVNLNIRAAGRDIKQFNPPLTVTIGAPGIPVGTPVAIFSVDEDTGQRMFEITSQVNSNRTIVFQIDHLTALGGARSIRSNQTGAQGGS